MEEPQYLLKYISYFFLQIIHEFKVSNGKNIRIRCIMICRRFS
jgi:hypothetical protein